MFLNKNQCKIRFVTIYNSFRKTKHWQWNLVKTASVALAAILIWNLWMKPLGTIIPGTSKFVVKSAGRQTRSEVSSSRLNCSLAKCDGDPDKLLRVTDKCKAGPCSSSLGRKMRNAERHRTCTSRAFPFQCKGYIAILFSFYMEEISWFSHLCADCQGG